MGDELEDTFIELLASIDLDKYDHTEAYLERSKRCTAEFNLIKLLDNIKPLVIITKKFHCRYFAGLRYVLSDVRDLINEKLSEQETGDNFFLNIYLKYV